MKKNNRVTCFDLDRFLKLTFSMLLIPLLFSVRSISAAPTAIRTVCAIGCDFTTIQGAINDAGTVNGDTITVNDAVHTEQGILVNKNLTIDGKGAVVQANAARNTAIHRVFKINAGSTVTIQNMTIQHGTGDDDGGLGVKVGGGIYNGGILTVMNSTVRDNDAAHASGIFNDGFTPGNTGTLTIDNSTVSGNIVTTDDSGAIYNFVGVVTIVYSTIANNNNNNSGGKGGGIHNSPLGGTVNIKNTIIADNTATASPDCNGTLTSQDYNLVENTSGCTIVGTTTNNITGIDPNLVSSLANNGTNPHPFTHALGAGSAAIDKIPTTDPTCNADGSSVDQRGGARANSTYNSGTACDMGAFEFGSTRTPTAVSLQSISTTNNTAILPILIATLMLLLVGGVALRRRAG